MSRTIGFISNFIVQQWEVSLFTVKANKKNTKPICKASSSCILGGFVIIKTEKLYKKKYIQPKTLNAPHVYHLQ